MHTFQIIMILRNEASQKQMQSITELINIHDINAVIKVNETLMHRAPKNQNIQKKSGGLW